VRRTPSSPGEDTLVILVSILLYPPSQFSLFTYLAPLFFCFFIYLFDLVSHICYFCVCFYQHRFYFQIDSTSPFHSMVQVRFQLFLCLQSLFVFLNRPLPFFNTVHSISPPVCISVYKFSRSCRLYCVALKLDQSTDR
jgi:hypothetical protein